ncbi:DNA excision repair protein ERCC-6-like 2 [Cyrtonyx montezumae]|uniref:DNA excision repair protein ERCC-6-like 2 n=1 Tax=Cyrtonyx montezumae TaxID=9017 RepID=UPI0032DAAC35
MTVTSWLKEEPPQCSSENYEQPGCEGARGPSSTKAQLEREETDFHDYFSDDDILEISKKKSDRTKPCRANNLMTAKGQISLMQCGFFNLLQREIETTKKGGNNDSRCSGSDSQTIRTDVNGKCNDVQKCRSYVHILEHREAAQSPSGNDKQDMHTADCLSDSEEEADRENEDLCISQQSDVVMETESSSEENCDVIFPTQFPSSPQAVHTKKIGIQRSASENSGGSLKEKDEFVLKKEYRQSGFHGTESNFSKVMSFVNMESSMKRDWKGASDISDESDDIEVPCNSESEKLRTLSFTKGEQRQTPSSALGKFSKSLLQRKKPSRKVKESGSQNIDEFSSSEDNLPVEKIHTQEQNYKSQRCGVQFRSKKLHSVQDRMCSVAQTKSSNYAMRRSSTQRAQFDHRNQNVESMDRYLDGVQEVAYMHSNQNVVGSSKAESHLSRWAMRDVFELKQFSQLPANIAVCSAKHHYSNNVSKMAV